MHGTNINQLHGPGSSEKKEGHGDGPVWIFPLSLSHSVLNDVQRDFLMYTYMYTHHI